MFADSRKIAKVTLSDSLTSITGSLFSHCYNLEFVNIPTSLINIEGQAFRDCYSMKCPMTLPATLVSIGGAAFQGTSNIPYIKILAQTPPSLSYSVFWNCDYPIYVPDASVDAYKTAQGWSEYTSRIKPMSEFAE